MGLAGAKLRFRVNQGGLTIRATTSAARGEPIRAIAVARPRPMERRRQRRDAPSPRCGGHAIMEHPPIWIDYEVWALAQDDDGAENQAVWGVAATSRASRFAIPWRLLFFCPTRKPDTYGARA